MSLPSDSLLVDSLSSKNSLIGAGSTPGKGMFAPTLAIKSKASVKNIFCLSSGILSELGRGRQHKTKEIWDLY